MVGFMLLGFLEDGWTDSVTWVKSENPYSSYLEKELKSFNMSLS